VVSQASGFTEGGAAVVAGGFVLGVLVMLISLGFCRVVPLWSLGLSGKRLVFFAWSPVRVGYILLEEGVWGFSQRIRLRLRLSICVLRVVFSCVRCWIIWQVWQFRFVMQLIWLPALLWCYSLRTIT